eukprot:gene6639-3033_t
MAHAYCDLTWEGLCGSGVAPPSGFEAGQLMSEVCVASCAACPCASSDDCAGAEVCARG